MPSLPELLGLAPSSAPWNSDLAFPFGPSLPTAMPWWPQNTSHPSIAPFADPVATSPAAAPPANGATDATGDGWLGGVLRARAAASSPTSGGILHGAVPDTSQDPSQWAGFASPPTLPPFGPTVADPMAASRHATGTSSLSQPSPPSVGSRPWPSQTTGQFETPIASGTLVPKAALPALANYKRDLSAPSGILSAIFGSMEPADGVIPKNLPEAPPPPPQRLSDWQRAESDIARDLWARIARIQPALAAGVSPDLIDLYSPGRGQRDAARMADLLLAGSGNLVSGDWSNFSKADLVNLAVGLASAIIPLPAEGRLAQAGIKAAQVASEAETMAAATRAAAGRLRGARLGPGGRPLTFAEDNNVLLYERARRILGQLDPRNRQLQVPTPRDWLPSLDNVHLLNDEIGAIRQHKGLLDLEGHHEYTRQHLPWFNSRGIDPHDYISYMWAWDHRLRPDGLHAGSNSWNPRWRSFINKNLTSSPDQVHQQLNQMLRLREKP